MKKSDKQKAHNLRVWTIIKLWRITDRIRSNVIGLDCGKKLSAVETDLHKIGSDFDKIITRFNNRNK